jgi:hypothetical protein
MQAQAAAGRRLHFDPTRAGKISALRSGRCGLSGNGQSCRPRPQAFFRAAVLLPTLGFLWQQLPE